MYKGKLKSLLGDYSDMIKSDIQLNQEYENYKVSFVVLPLVKKGGINIIGAERSSGKTRLTVHLAYGLIYQSNDFLGYIIKFHGSVLYINLEINEADFKTILRSSEEYYIKRGLTKIHSLSTLNAINNLDLKFNQIKGIVAEIKPTLIIVDGFKMLSSLYCSELGISEMKNQHIAEFYKELRAWQSESPGATILITNHTNKGTSHESTHSDLQFGPGALLDYADQVCLIRKTQEDNQRIIIPTKTRYSDESESGCNVFQFMSNDDNSQVWPELIATDVNESDFRHKSKSTYTKEQKEKAKLLHAAGMPMSEIAKEVGGESMSKGNIAKWKKNNWK